MSNALPFVCGLAIGIAAGVVLTVLLLAFLMGMDNGTYTEEDYKD